MSAEQQLETSALELAIRKRELQVAEQVYSELEREQEATTQQIASLTGLITRQKQFLGTRLAALYRMGRLSYVRVLLSIDGSKNPMDAIAMLSYLVSRDARAVSDFQQTKERLATHGEELKQRRVIVARARDDVDRRRAALEKSRSANEVLLAKLRSESNSSEQRLAELEEKARRLENLFRLLYDRNRLETPAGATIGEFKGALEWPLRGEVVEKFGKQRNPRFATYTMSNGVRVEAPAGNDVRAVFEGTVLFAQWFKGYGNLVIIDHGDRVFSLYGNLRSVAVQVGERVAPLQTIAGVGETEGEASGHLYFEIREDNKPVDPEQWLR